MDDTVFTVIVIILNVVIILSLILGIINLIFALKSIYYRKTYVSKAKKLYDDSNPLSVALFIPCKGIEEHVDDYLNGMLGQDYPDFRVYFITESEKDPATPLISDLIKDKKNASLVIAGRTTKCCQKNHNLLAGVREELKQNKVADYFVFADADVQPNKTWLKDLVQPLSSADVQATTAFRWLKPKKFSFFGTMHAMLSAYLGTLMSSSDGMWGGSMAIKREDFIKYGVDKRWETAVADDISLMEIVIKNKLKRVFVPICSAESSSVINDGKALFEWFLRQIQYLKTYCKVHWITSIIFISLNTITTILLLALSLYGLLYYDILSASLSWQLCNLNPIIVLWILCILFIMIMSMSRFEGKEGQSYFVWCLMMTPSIIMGFICLIASIFRSDMIWRGIRYGINKDGTVSFVKVEKENG